MGKTFLAQNSYDRYEIALDAAGIGIWDSDLVSQKIFFSATSHELFNIPRESEVSLDELLCRMHPTDRIRTRQKLSDCMNPDIRAPYENEYRIIDPKDGHVVRWVRSRGRVFFSEDGRACRFTGIIQDITAEIRANEKEQKLLTLVDNSIELMSILESNQRNSYLNKAGMEMLGFDTVEQVYATPISELHTPEDLEFVKQNVLPGVINEGRWSGIMNVRHLKTGEVFPVYNNSIRIRDKVTGEPIAVGAVMMDMRPVMATQKALFDSERSFRSMVMQAPVGICIMYGKELVFEEVNDLFIQMAGARRDELVGKTIYEAMPDIVSEGYADILLRVMETGQPYFGKEFEIVLDKESNKSIYVDFTFQPLRDTDGVIKRTIVLAIDVTDKIMARNNLEQNEAELQKRVAERTAELEKKNKELEEFSYVSSHDLQEPIRKIKMFREIIRANDYDTMTPISREKFDKIGESLERLSNSLRDLLDFASLNKEERQEPVDLHEILEEVKTDLELLIEQKNAKIITGALPTINAVPHQMHQLFYNLLNNSIKFSQGDKAPVIQISCTLLPPDKQKEFPELHADLSYYEICVIDNGIGFEQDQAEKIFGLFHRLHSKQAYSGTGIGLAMCRKIMEKHQGHIYATSVEGQETVFHILVPR